MLNRRKSLLALAAAVLVLGALACSFSASTASIKNAVMTLDPAGEQPTAVFSPDQAFYCIVNLANAPDDTVVKAVWIASAVEGTDPGYVIDEVEITTGQPQIVFDLSNDSLWPNGTYQVDLYLNGELDRSVDFEVR